MESDKQSLLHLTGVKRAFLGYQETLDGSDVVILPVPYDSTTSYGVGTRFGPNAIIDASMQLELYDIEMGRDICEALAIHTLDELEVDRGDPSRTSGLVGKAVSSILALGKKPVVLGGEHSVTAGAVSGLRDPEGTSVLQIDAHTDLRDSWDGSRYSHACAMRRVLDLGCNVVHVGIRSMSADEARYIDEEKLWKTVFLSKDVRGRMPLKEIISQLKEKVYVSVDVDGFDPSVFPGTGTPEPGGLLFDDALELMKAVGKERDVVGFDIVEVQPLPGSHVTEFAAAKLCYKMMGYFWLD